jgi:hypothetical protein
MKELVHTWKNQPYTVEATRPRAPSAPRTPMDDKVCSNGFSRQAAKWLVRQIFAVKARPFAGVFGEKAVLTNLARKPLNGAFPKYLN